MATYIMILVLFTIVGIGVPIILIYAFVVDPIYCYYIRKRSGIQTMNQEGKKNNRFRDKIYLYYIRKKKSITIKIQRLMKKNRLNIQVYGYNRGKKSGTKPKHQKYQEKKKLKNKIYYYFKEKKNNNKPIRKVSVFKEKKETLGDKIFVFFALVGISILCVWSFCMVRPYYLDIPNIITKNYTVKSGRVTVYANASTSMRTWGYNGITVNGVNYKIGNDSDLKNGMSVTIKYLPHTQIIKELWYREK